MGLFFRKSIKFGPARINFSKSGMGMSFGVKGARVSFGPKGTYVSMGKGGIYYRQKIGNSPNKNKRIRNTRPSVDENNYEPIENAGIKELGDSRFEYFIDEINEKNNKIELFKIYKCLLLIFYIIVGIKDSFIGGLVLVLPLYLIGSPLKILDNSNKTINLDYELDKDTEKKYLDLIEGLKILQKSKNVWRVVSEANVTDYKRNGGAANIVKRAAVIVGSGLPKFLKVNVEVFKIGFVEQQLYFLPDMILIYENHQVAAMAYEDIQIEVGTTESISHGITPADSFKIGSTWKYVNKDGSRDKRYSNNVQMDILKYGTMLLKSNSGLNLRFEISNHEAPILFKDALSEMSSFMKKINNRKKIL